MCILSDGMLLFCNIIYIRWINLFGVVFSFFTELIGSKQYHQKGAVSEMYFIIVLCVWQYFSVLLLHNKVIFDYNISLPSYIWSKNTSHYQLNMNKNNIQLPNAYIVLMLWLVVTLCYPIIVLIYSVPE